MIVSGMLQRLGQIICSITLIYMSLRVALAQVNPRVGDLQGNAALIRNFAKKAHELEADLVAFPEMVLTGYPIEDLSLRKSFQEASQKVLKQLAQDLVFDGLEDLTVVVGYLDATGENSNLGIPSGAPENAAAVIRNGEIITKYVKHHLPNYGVFDEYRYFVPGKDTCSFEVKGLKVSLAICEDIWQEGGPVAEISKLNSDLLIVINGSPYEYGKDDVRLELVQKRAKQVNAPIAYVNMVGGQDELVFDGDSLVVNKDGALVTRAAKFIEELVIFELEANKSIEKTNSAKSTDNLVEVYQALVLGLRDYVIKNEMESVVLGLSGGIDSALVATIAVDALGAQNVYGVAMPSKFSSQHSVDDATDLAKRLELNFRTIPIKPFFESFQESLKLIGLAQENLQARLRGITLMGISNQEGHLVLATGNKSELAVGYSTIYGDAVGGFAPIKDVSKTMVWQLAKWRNKQTTNQPIPEASITKAPSAELRPDQLDSDSLPDYEKLDPMIQAYVEQDQGAFEMATKGLDKELIEKVLKMIDKAEYKRRQYPPGTKISVRAFGRDRRQPITNAWIEKL
jgi:NAD+ synthase (glutamine-hydrolysing)